MQKTTFIIISPSFLIKKGISSVIQHLDNTLVYDELDNLYELDLSSPYHIPDFIVIDSALLNNDNIHQLTNYIEKYHVALIGFNDKTSYPLKYKTILDINDSEENLTNKLLLSINGYRNNNGANNSNLAISKRETNVLQMVAKGYTNKEIAEKLYISLHTVITHRKNITKKLGIKTVSGLTVYAILNNIIELKDIEQ